MKMISYKNLPMTSPLHWTVTVYLLLEQTNAGAGWWVASAVVLVALWGTFFVSMSARESVDIFDG